jgi:hypothetical protein
MRLGSSQTAHLVARHPRRRLRRGRAVGRAGRGSPADGRSLTTISIGPAHIDLATGETTATGILRNITVPGAGVVYATAGRYVIVSATGEVLDFSGLDVPPGEEVCDALSG